MSELMLWEALREAAESKAKLVEIDPVSATAILDKIYELTARIAELEAEVTKCHELQDSYCDRIAELEGLVDKLIEVGDELADDREYQDDLADLWHDVTRGLKEREE